MDPQPEFVVGLQVDSLDEAQRVSIRFIQSLQQSFRYFRTDKDRGYFEVVYRLGKKKCPFRILFKRAKKAQTWTLAEYHQHTCPPDTHKGWRRGNSVKVLSTYEHNIALLNDNMKTKPHVLKTQERLTYGNEPSYKQMWRTRLNINEGLYGDESKTFEQLPALLTEMRGDVEAGERTAWTAIQKQGSRFFRCVIVPTATAYASAYIPNFWALDGTHCMSKHRMILLAITALDGNHKRLPLAWAVVPVENKDNWKYFLEFAVQHLQRPEGEDAVVVSDRDKGLLETVADFIPGALHVYCSKHLADNVEKRYGRACSKLFWKYAKATTKPAYNAAINACREANPQCGQYVSNILPKHYARYAIKRPRYGQITSNVQESQNSEWLPIRQLPILYLMAEIWNHIMTSIYTRRRQRMIKSSIMTDWAADYIANESKRGSKFKVRSSTNTHALVNCPKNEQHVVNLDKGSCICVEFQDLKLPCRHAWAVCRANEQEVSDHVASSYLLATYRDVYNAAIAPQPMIIQGLKHSKDCLAPLIQKRTGRPREKRFRSKRLGKKGTPGQRAKCGICHQPGHNRRNCDFSDKVSRERLSDINESNDDGTSDDASDDSWTSTDLEESSDGTTSDGLEDSESGQAPSQSNSERTRIQLRKTTLAGLKDFVLEKELEKDPRSPVDDSDESDRDDEDSEDDEDESPGKSLPQTQDAAGNTGDSSDESTETDCTEDLFEWARSENAQIATLRTQLRKLPSDFDVGTYRADLEKKLELLLQRQQEDASRVKERGLFEVDRDRKFRVSAADKLLSRQRITESQYDEILGTAEDLKDRDTRPRMPVWKGHSNRVRPDTARPSEKPSGPLTEDPQTPKQRASPKLFLTPNVEGAQPQIPRDNHSPSLLAGRLRPKRVCSRTEKGRIWDEEQGPTAKKRRGNSHHVVEASK